MAIPGQLGLMGSQLCFCRLIAKTLINRHWFEDCEAEFVVVLHLLKDLLRRTIMHDKTP